MEKIYSIADLEYWDTLADSAAATTSEGNQSVKPWKQSNSPRSEKGKVPASHNGWKGGTRPILRATAAALRQQRELLDEVNEF